MSVHALVYSATERNLLARLGAHGLRENNLGQICLDCEHASTRRQRADVDHEHLEEETTRDPRKSERELEEVGQTVCVGHTRGRGAAGIRGRDSSLG